MGSEPSILPIVRLLGAWDSLPPNKAMASHPAMVGR